jgi:glycosyltransferase A (GT-A) superfamily protein (DUF2064 family)
LSSSTAILLFAQPVAHDAASKRVAYGARVRRQVVERLNKHTRLTAEATGLPVVQSTALITHGGSFGDQLVRACQATFALGFERVLIVGNDCPALTTAHLIEAAERLKTAPVVLGPDRRGGLYLVGLSREAFEGSSLIGLPWQTSQLAKATRLLYAQQPVVVLSPLTDINGRADLQHYADSTTTVALFIRALLALGVGGPSLVSYLQPVLPVGICLGTRSLRAPPALGCAAVAA